jgi:hypothetical protein
MRLYSFVNYYMSQLQHGLQTAHCVSDMACNVLFSGIDSPEADAFYKWAEDHKTIIICNGGNTQQLEDLHFSLVDLAAGFNLPLVKFYEDEQSLNCALTSVAVLVPEWAYDSKFFKGETSPDAYVWNHAHLNDDVDMPSTMRFVDGTNKFKFISIIKSYRLA